MRTLAVTLAGLTATVLMGVFGCSPARDTPAAEARTRVVRVAAAADLRFGLDEVVGQFQRTHPDVQVPPTYGSSGNLFAQLQNRAPFDLFLSADVEYPRRLIDEGLASGDSRFSYAVGHLVVWVPRTSTLDLDRLGFKALLDPSVKKIAIANPRFAPYGRAAEAALKTAGVYDQVRDRLVHGENVGQAAQFVQTGAAEAGVIALSLALSPALKEGGRFWEVPPDTYPRLEQGGVILTWARDREAAEAFRAFLKGPEGKAILRRYGFFLPEE